MGSQELEHQSSKEAPADCSFPTVSMQTPPIRSSQAPEQGFFITNSPAGGSDFPLNAPFSQYSTPTEPSFQRSPRLQNDLHSGVVVYSPPPPPYSSSMTAYPTHHDFRERSPARLSPSHYSRRFDRRRHIIQELDPVVENQDSNDIPMSIDSQETLRISPAQRISSTSSISAARFWSPHTRPSLQYNFFLALERICKSAAGKYHRKYCQLGSRSKHSGCVIPGAHHFLFSCANGRAQDLETRACPYGLVHVSLRHFTRCISLRLWTRAMRAGEYTQESEAVHRMKNLYSWVEKVTGARTRVLEEGSTGIGEEEAFNIVMAARDMCGWLLNDKAKNDVDVLWEERGMFGNILSG